MTRQFSSIWFWFSVLALAILAVFLLYPLLNVLTGSIGSGGRNGWVTLAGDPKYFAAILNTIVLGIAVTLTTTLIGVPLAYFTARFDFPGKGIVAVLPLITLVIPEVIAAQTWLMMLGNNGFITRWLGGHGIDMPSFYGWPGLITVMPFTYYAYI